jgi:hypothetical protein
LRNKLFIFFIIGILLYLIDIGLNSDEDKNIYISDQEVISLINAWKSQVGREPTDDEISRIINNLVQEEILYREALNLGLEREDKIIKRRLAQKISFLKQESILKDFSQKEIIDFYKANRDKYYVPGLYTFTHKFFSSSSNSKERAQNHLNNSNRLYENSDPFFLGKNFAETSSLEINSNFGSNFSLYFENSPINQWIGPYKSSFGHHNLFITEYTPGFHPNLDDIYDQVMVDLNQLKRDSAISDFIKEVGSDYSVIINPDLKI